MNTLSSDELAEIVSYLDPTEIRNLVDSEMLYAKIPLYTLEKVATKYNLPLTDSVIELDKYYHMTMYRKLQHGNLEYVIKNLMTIMEANILLEERKNVDIFEYVYDRVNQAIPIYKLNGKQTYNAYMLDVDIGQNEIYDLLVEENYQGILEEAATGASGDRFLMRLAKQHLSPDEYIDILSKSKWLAAELELKRIQREEDGIDNLEMLNYILQGNYKPDMVKKYLKKDYYHSGTRVDTALTLAMVGDFKLSSDLVGREIRNVSDLLGEKIHDTKINKAWIAQRSIECDNVEIYKQYRKDLYAKYNTPSPKSERMALELLKDNVKIFYSKCVFDHRTILEKFPEEAKRIANHYAGKNDRRVLDIVDKYPVNLSKLLRWAVRDPNFTPHISLKLIEKGAMLKQAWVATLEAYWFCIDILHLDPKNIQYVDRSVEGDSEMVRLGHSSWSEKGKVRI